MARVIADRFELLSLAGRGGMGEVWRAKDRVTERFAAVKLLRRDLSSTVHNARFLREASALASLRHPRIVRAISHGFSENDEIYLAMEWLDGETLADRLLRARVETADAVEIARGTAEALAHAHERGLVHRDVKPKNVFLVNRRADGASVIDFGIAREAQAPRMTSTGALLGTPEYMAPEQARGTSEIDARADVFSLGCILYEMLAGRPPFAGSNSVAVLAKVLLEPAEPLSTAPHKFGASHAA